MKINPLLSRDYEKEVKQKCYPDLNHALLTAILANLVFKAGMVAALGGWRLFKVVALLLALPLLGGGVVLWLWPH